MWCCNLHHTSFKSVTSLMLVNVVFLYCFNIYDNSFFYCDVIIGMHVVCYFVCSFEAPQWFNIYNYSFLWRHYWQCTLFLALKFVKIFTWIFDQWLIDPVVIKGKNTTMILIDGEEEFSIHHRRRYKNQLLKIFPFHFFSKYNFKYIRFL